MKIKIKLTVDSKPMSDEDYDRITTMSFENHGNGIEAFPRDYEESPMPWDAGCSIENGDFVLEGHAGPSGFGYSKMFIPLDKVNSYFEEIFVYVDNSEGVEEVEAILRKYNWL